MDAAHNVAQPVLQWRWRILMWALLATAFTAWSIQYSYRHGRLIAAPGFDDVVYFCEGVDRLDEYYCHGWKGLLRSLAQKPPHAPFSTALATCSFGLFGMHEWAPYAGNGIIIFALIACIEFLLLGVPRWLRITGLAFVLSMPFATFAVIEFRPDIAVGIVTAFGVVLAVNRSLTESPWRYAGAVGVVFGVAFLIKPTMFVMTFGLWGLSLGLGLLSDWYLNRPPLRTLVLRYAGAAIATAMVAGPYFVWNGKHTASYIYHNIFGTDAALWQTPGTAEDHFWFYLIGDGAQQMIDNTTWILVALIPLGIAAVLARRQKAEMVRLAALAICTIAAVSVPTIAKCKHGFYGMSFFALLAFWGVLALRQIYAGDPSLSRRWRWAASLALIAVTLVVLGQHPHVPTLGTRGDSSASTSRQTCEDIAAALISHGRGEPPIVFTTVECQYANADTLRWLTAKEGYKFTFVSVPMGSGLDCYHAMVEKSDLIVAFETKNPVTKFASERQASSILAMLRAMPRVVEVDTFPSFGGVNYYLFKKRHADFTPWKSTKGLGLVEGPYPQWKLPRVRWGLGEESSVRFDVTTDEAMCLSVRCRTSLSGQTLTVLCDGKQVERHPLAPATEFAAIDVPLPPLSRGEHELTLQYAVADSTNDPRRLAVLFERLQLLPMSAR